MTQNDAEGAEPTPLASPSGNDPALLDAVRGWNWGAFLLPMPWAFGHRLWAWGTALFAAVLASPLIAMFAMFAGWFTMWIHFALMVFCPLFYLGVGIYLGMRGNELAWRVGHNRGLDHFRAVERVWRNWGIILAAIWATITVMGLLGYWGA